MYHLLNRNIYDLQLHIIVTYRVMNLSAVTAGNRISFSFLLKCLVRKRALAKDQFIYYVSFCRGVGVLHCVLNGVLRGHFMGIKIKQ